jgi:hypothetical protein
MNEISRPSQQSLFMDLEHMAAGYPGLERILAKRFVVGYSNSTACAEQENETLLALASTLSRHKFFTEGEGPVVEKFAYRGLMVGSIIGARVLGQQNWGLDNSVLQQETPLPAEDLSHIGNRFLVRRPVLGQFAEKFHGAACPGIKSSSVREIAYDSIGLALKLAEDHHLNRLASQEFAGLAVEHAT